VMTLVEELSQQVGISQACQVLDVPRSWYYRQRGGQQTCASAAPERPSPKQALNAGEKRAVRAVLNSERFMDQPPREVYATLLDEGQYLCHWRTMYRVLAEHDEVRDRRAWSTITSTLSSTSLVATWWAG